MSRALRIEHATRVAQRVGIAGRDTRGERRPYRHPDEHDGGHHEPEACMRDRESTAFATERAANQCRADSGPERGARKNRDRIVQTDETTRLREARSDSKDRPRSLQERTPEPTAAVQ